ncbi:hypothetical protein [Motilimonas pumila]|nr:hypothetical protein [Motilimonas pumila]
MLQQFMRLQLYAGLGFFAFAMVALGTPLGNNATWIACLIMVAIGLWIELGKSFQDPD